MQVQDLYLYFARGAPIIMGNELRIENDYMINTASIKHRELALFLEHFSHNDNDFSREAFVNLCEDTNEDTVIKILAHFNENLKEAELNMKQAFDEQNCEIFWKSAHKIAGSAELLGFKHFADQSRDLSRQVRANPVFESHMDSLKQYCGFTENLSSEISALLPSLKSYL
jgi:HPt (histidine-containing phosphotransfer) domain-containing protein